MSLTDPRLQGCSCPAARMRGPPPTPPAVQFLLPSRGCSRYAQVQFSAVCDKLSTATKNDKPRQPNQARQTDVDPSKDWTPLARTLGGGNAEDSVTEQHCHCRSACLEVSPACPSQNAKSPSSANQDVCVECHSWSRYTLSSAPSAPSPLSFARSALRLKLKDDNLGLAAHPHALLQVLCYWVSYCAVPGNEQPLEYARNRALR